MGKKYVVIEVRESSSEEEDGWFAILLLCLLPPILTFALNSKFRDSVSDGDLVTPRKTWIVSIVSMSITLALSIGLFFGVSYLSAAFPFFMFFWSGINLAYGIIWDIGSEGVKRFIEQTRIDIAVFYCMVFLMAGMFVDLMFIYSSQSSEILNKPKDPSVNLTWLICAICSIHICVILLFAYLNDICYDMKHKISYFLVTLLYLSPALFYIGFAAVHAVAPKAVIPLVKPFGSGQFPFYFVLSISAAFMIAEGICLIVGNGCGCALYGILQGVLNFVFSALAIVSCALSLSFTPYGALQSEIVPNREECRSIEDALLSLEQKADWYDYNIDFNGLQVTIDDNGQEISV